VEEKKNHEIGMRHQVGTNVQFMHSRPTDPNFEI